MAKQLWGVVILLLSSCISTHTRHSTDRATAAIPSVRITVREAEKLVRQDVFAKNPRMNRAVRFPLEEVTTPDIWNRFGVQIFRVAPGVYPSNTYLIRDNQVTLLGASFGGPGVTAMAIADLDSDGAPELAFSYSFGSGMTRSQVALWRQNGNVLVAPTTYWNGDMIVRAIDDHRVDVIYGHMRQNSGFDQAETVGILRYDQKASPPFDIELSRDLAPEVAAHLRR
ncbi:MAG TPA: hypothetical protein VF669_09875 [Tepidisphaeraceae bacterium]|jgi:hypothetical protein